MRILIKRKKARNEEKKKREERKQKESHYVKVVQRKEFDQLEGINHQ